MTAGPSGLEEENPKTRYLGLLFIALYTTL